MGKRLHAPRTAPRSVSEATPLSAELLRHIAKDITRAKATLEPSVFSAALHLIQNPSMPVAPLPSRASARHWQGIAEASARQRERTQLQTLAATRASSARAAPAPPSFQRATQAQRGIAPSQHWHAQIQRFGIESYAKHYSDQSDFQTRSADLASSGEALHPVLRQALEAHFQQRLPAIQIHSDASAAARARAVGALAFTSGAGIHFGAGQYQPFTSAGFKLLVHETTHVLQQMSGIVPEGIDTDPSLERAAQLEASRVSSVPSLNDAPEPSVSSQRVAPQFETAGQWAAHLLNTLKHHSVPRERFAAVTGVFAQIPADQQGKARALMLGKLNPNSSEHGRLETALVVAPNVKSGISSTTQGRPRQAGELNFFTYLNPLERDVVLPNYKAFPISSDTLKASPNLETVVPTPSKSAGNARAPRQAFRATHATTRAIQRQRAEPPKLLSNINAVGMVLNNDGVKVYAKPNTTGKDTPFTQLPFNDHVLVLKEYSGGWYQIALSVGAKGATGFVNKKFVQIRAGDPGANLQKVTKGQSAIGIAEKYYKQFIKPGEDLRYFVNVLAHVNPKALNQPTTGNWKDVKFNADTTIYIPSPTKALTYRSVVESGSLTGGMVARVGDFMKRIYAVIQSAQNSTQYIGEVLGDLWDVIKENWVGIVAMTAGLIAAELVVGALAVIPEPTMLTKVIAVLLQGAIVLVCGAGVVTGLIGAYQEGKNWVTTAWTSNGDAKKSKEASKAYLRMVAQIALTYLAVLGVRGSFGKFKPLWAKYRSKLPAVQSKPTIASPLKGNPKAIWRGYASLSRIQQEVLNQLPGKGSQTIIPKGTFKLKDLAALSASTGDEFAMFTAAGRRLIMRGTRDGVPVNQELAASLAKKGWRWSAHTHPDGSLRSSAGDRLILSEFGNKQSAILTSEGTWKLFNQNGDLINSSWLP